MGLNAKESNNPIKKKRKKRIKIRLDKLMRIIFVKLHCIIFLF